MIPSIVCFINRETPQQETPECRNATILLIKKRRNAGMPECRNATIPHTELCDMLFSKQNDLIFKLTL